MSPTNSGFPCCVQLVQPLFTQTPTFLCATDYSEQADVQSCKDRKALQSIDKRLAILEQTTIKQLAVINHKLDKPNIGCGCGGGGGDNGPYTCGGTGGWRRVVTLNMTNSSATCPKGLKFKQYSKRTCGMSTHRSARVVCDSVSFPISGGQYTQVCGKVKAYQRGFSYGFFKNYGDIDVPYMDGVIVTHGGPRKHIWTFASGFKEGGSPSPYSCPCETTSTYPIEVPSFVGNDYFCDVARKVGWNYNEGENYQKFFLIIHCGMPSIVLPIYTTNVASVPSLHISLRNSLPQRVMTLRAGSVSMVILPLMTL